MFTLAHVFVEAAPGFVEAPAVGMGASVACNEPVDTVAVGMGAPGIEAVVGRAVGMVDTAPAWVWDMVGVVVDIVAAQAALMYYIVAFW